MGVDGCDHLPFTPSLEVAPDGHAASSSSGLTVAQHIDQQESLNASGLAVSDVRAVTAVLPEGVQINPSGGDGLEACSEGQIGFTGLSELDPKGEPGAKTTQFTPTLPSPFCPDAAKIGTVHIKTPLLKHELVGAVYLADQNQNPFGSLVAMYLVAEEPESGVLLKLPGSVSLSPSGRITATFENLPQAPFEDARLEFFGGERAPLATPAHCGAYTTEVIFTPWSGNATGARPPRRSTSAKAPTTARARARACRSHRR